MSLHENISACFKGHNILSDAMKAIIREVAGCGPDCSKEFHRMALDSVTRIARKALDDAGVASESEEPSHG